MEKTKGKNLKKISSLENQENVVYESSDSDVKSFIYSTTVLHDTNVAARRKLKIILFICGCFIILESIGAYLSKSIAIFTDVAHLISDFIGFLFSLLSMQIATQKANYSFTYGFIRAEILGAFFSIILIWCLTVWVFYEAINRYLTQAYMNLDAGYMLITAFGALFVNLLMGYFLHDHGHEHDHHGHDHGHSHSPVNDNKKKSPKVSPNQMKLITSKDKSDKEKDSIFIEDKKTECVEKNCENSKEHKDQCNAQVSNSLLDEDIDQETQPILANPQKPTQNHNMRAAWVHILGDTVQTVGVIIISLIIYFNPEYKFLDPFISIMFAFIAVLFSLPIFKELIILLMDSVPPSINTKKIVRRLERIEGVVNVHDIHIWQLSQGKIAMTCHFTVIGNYDYILQEANKEAKKNGILHTTIQLETHGQTKYQISCRQNIHSEFLGHKHT